MESGDERVGGGGGGDKGGGEGGGEASGIGVSLWTSEASTSADRSAACSPSMLVNTRLSNGPPSTTSTPASTAEKPTT